MSVSIKKIKYAQILEDTSVNENSYIQTGYMLTGESTKKGKILENGTPNVSVGSVYQAGNISRSFVNLSNISTLIGSFTLENSPENDLELVIYNYLTSLIPGMYIPISGPWNETQNYYNLEDISFYINNNNNAYFCKILGLGLGDISSWQVANVNKNQVSFLANSSNQGQDPSGFVDYSQAIKQLNWSCTAEDYVFPLTTLGTNFYMTGFDWQNFYGISLLNGTNSFPYFGWAGARIGSIKPVTFQFQQNSLYNYPSSLLQLSKEYNPIGIIYAGQGIQYNSFSREKNNTITFENRNKRTYQYKLTNTSNKNIISSTGIIPYQTGRGIYDYFSNEVTYNQRNGIVDTIEYPSIIGAEGVQPGRNSAFVGVALTDYWSKTINMNNLDAGSTTSKDSRLFLPKMKQTKTAHNSPLSYSSEPQNNTYNPLPWNSLISYVGDTTSSSSNNRSDNTPILNNGITTMVITGAYPLYRSAWSFTFDNKNPTVGGILTAKDTYDQYYFTEEFWNPDFDDPGAPQTSDVSLKPPIPQNPPYRIKGGRIILYEGQKVKAGSYVYSAMNICNNVGVAQFYPPSAKEIKINGAERDQLLGDLYSKYQGNQGGLIVMVSINGKPPPMPPSCAQPIGIILEDVIGFGNPLEDYDGKVKYEYQSTRSVHKQTVFDVNTTMQIQGRDVLVEIFPMYANYYLSGVPTGFFFFLFFFFTFPLTTGVSDFSLGLNGITNKQEFNPLYIKIKSNYILNTSPNSWPSSATVDNFGAGLSTTRPPWGSFDFQSKQMMNDWPGPQSNGFFEGNIITP